MQALFQLSTRSYEEEIPLIKKAMIELEGICKIKNSFTIGEPFTRAGWTFFTIQINSEMVYTIEKTGMLDGAIGFRIPEQLKNFLGHFLESHGSQIRIKKIDY